MPEIYRLPKEIIENKHIRIIINKPANTTPLHMHDYFEIELVISGKCKQLLNGTVYDIGKGSLYLLSPVDFHQMFDFESTLTAINICFDNYFYSSDIVQKFMNKTGNIVLCMNAEEMKVANDIINQLRESCEPNDRYTERYTKNILECFLIFILRLAEKNSIPAFSSELDPIQKGMQHLFLHYRENPTIEEMAKKCGYSSGHFCRQFKALTGRTYIDFLNSLKINYSKILLLTSKTAIIEVADICGFNSVSNFNRVFKAEVGVSPSEFIKQYSKA